MNEKPTHLDLFSGIGGFSLAFEAEGFQTIGFSEIEPYACKVLKRHWPNVVNYGDIRNVPAVRCDVLTGGFPCQPFSCAGKRRGKADDRYLWPAMLDVIARCQPTWVVGENVPGILSLEFDSMLSDLEGKGYVVQPIIVPACAVDAQHRRDRVWIVGHSVSDTKENGNPKFQVPSEREATGIKSDKSGGSELVAHSNPARSQRRNGGELPERECERPAWSSGSFVSYAAGNGRHERNTNGGRSGEGATKTKEWPGLADYCRWQPEPELGRVANGIPNRAHRLKGLGNAIVPQVAQVIAHYIRKLIP